MKRIIGGSFLAGVMAVFAFLSSLDFQWYLIVWFCVFWFSISGGLIFTGYKQIEKGKREK